MYSVGDPVKVNSIDDEYRNGEVIAVLTVGHEGFPVIVKHESFGSRAGPVYQPFSQSGRAKNSELVNISRRPHKRYAAVYAQAGILYWRDEAPEETGIGYLTADYDPGTLKYSNVTYTTSETL